MINSHDLLALQDYLRLLMQADVTLVVGDDRLELLKGLSLPWQWTIGLQRGLPIKEFVYQIWEPIYSYVRTAVRLLATYTRHIGLVLDSSRRMEPHLAYIFEFASALGVQPPLSSWIAGLPSSEDLFEQYSTRFASRIPLSYRKFIGIHNGFLLDGWKSTGLRSVQDLYYLDIEQLANRHGSDSNPIAFSGNGLGDEQCYDLSKPIGTQDFLTFQWDHETHNVGNPITFWQYFERLLEKELKLALPNE